MTLELLKVLVSAVVLERDENGAVVGERVSDPTPLYNLEQIAEWTERIRAELASQQNGAVPPERVPEPSPGLAAPERPRRSRRKAGG
jgi:hypothetical protein